MKILLTPAVTADIIRKYNIRSEMDVVPLVAEIKKAQLKRVVDIIKEKQAYTAIVSQTGNEIPFFNPIDWEEIWQALLKEVEDEPLVEE